MSFFSRQVDSQKWGIYSEAGLLATVSCEATCETILANLKNGRRDTPKGAMGELYKAPELQSEKAGRDSPISASSKNNGRRSSRPPVPARTNRKPKANKASSLSSLQKHQITVAKAAGTSTPQPPSADNAKRA